MSVPNQRKIFIERSTDSVRKDFFKVGHNSLYSAMYHLKPSSFCLWCYLADNSQGYSLDLYPIDFCNKSGLSKSTFDRCFEELEEKGYLIKSQKKKNLFMFKEISEKVNMPDIINTLDTTDFNKVKEEYFTQNDTQSDSQNEE